MQFSRNSRMVQRVPTDTLRLPALPVQHNPKKQVEKAKKFLAQFDQVPLVYAGADGEILFGEEIWLACKETGVPDVDAIIISDKSSAELKAIRLALHRLPADARWIDHNVQIVLTELETAGLDLDLTAFDPPEIDSFLNLDLPKANVEESGSDIPPLEISAISKLGSIWKCGEHRIGCGSATDLPFVQQVLGDCRAGVCFTDPPYNLKIHGVVGGKGRYRRREFVQGSGELSPEEHFALLRDAFLVAKACCTESALIYACIDWRHVMDMLVAGRASGLPLYQIIAWVKSNGGMGGIYRNQHELICVFNAGGDNPLDNVELGKRGRNRTNVWSYPGMSAFGKDRNELLALHPTVKPVAMIADALRDCTKRGDVVLDCFLGSGATLMAADETGRIFRGVDLDPLYVDVAVRRWEKATGREAISLETGEPFDAVRQRLLMAPTEREHGA
jgi:DNA modification methylase